PDRLARDRVVDEVLRETEPDDVARHRRRIRPHTLELTGGIRDEARAADAARRAGERVRAVLRLDVRPRAAAHVTEERADVVLERLARVHRAGRVLGR